MAVRLPPQNLEAEQSVLGGLMLDPSVTDTVLEELTSDDFYKESHRRIFQAAVELNKRSQNIDVLTITNILKDKNELELVGGATYIAELLEVTPTTFDIKNACEIIRDKAMLRKLVGVGNEIIEKAYQPDFDDVGVFLDQIEAKVFQVADKRKTEGLMDAGSIIKESLSRIEFLYQSKATVTGVPSGFTDLDKLTSGFQPGELIIIAARPSMGKTAFSLNIATHAALRLKKTVAYFSVEMAKSQMMMRVLASESQINMQDLRVGRLADSAWPKLISTCSTISEAPLYIDDTSGISPYEIRAKVRRLKAQKGLDLIMIDYLQIMDLKQKVESRERAVAEISKTLKSIAKEFQVPVIALAQLNRGVEGRADRRPMLSDLRESGSIEQDADVIMMLYRDDYYEKNNSEHRGVAEVIIAKQRNGPTDTVKLAWLANVGMFANLAPDSYQQQQPPPTQMNRGQRSGDVPNMAPRGRQPDQSP